MKTNSPAASAHNDPAPRSMGGQFQNPRRLDLETSGQAFRVQKNVSDGIIKSCITALLMVVCLLFASCDPVWFSYDAEEMNETVIAVELINYVNPNVVELNNFIPIHKVKPYDFKKEEVVEALDEARFSDFFDDFSKLSMSSRWYHADEPFGYSIRITYGSGSFDMFSFDYENGTWLGLIAQYDVKGKLIKYKGIFDGYEKEYTDLIEKYFGWELE